MREKFDDNSITSRYKLRISRDARDVKIVDQYEQKFMKCEILKPTSKEDQDFVEGLEVPMYSLKDSTNTPMGEITYQIMDKDLQSYTIKNSLGEAVATITIHYGEKLIDAIIKTPTKKFMVVKAEKTEEKRNWRGKRSTKKYTTKIKVVDEKENHCFSIIPKGMDRKDVLFEINIVEGLLDLNPFIICTTSFLISLYPWWVGS